MRRQGIASLILYAFSHITRLSLACIRNFGVEGWGLRDGTARPLVLESGDLCIYLEYRIFWQALGFTAAGN